MPYTEKTWDETMRDLRLCMEKYPGLVEWRVERLVEGRKYGIFIERTDEDGLQRLPASNPPYNFATVTLYYKLRDREPPPMACSKYPTARENLRVIFNCIEALRLIAVCGLDELVRTHYAQLPPPQDDTPYRVLGLPPTASRDEAERRYRELVKRYHEAGTEPNPDRLAAINDAIARIRKERKS